MRGFAVTNDETERLVRRAKAGDRSAFDELIEIHRDRLTSWVRTRVGEKVRRSTDVEDLLQDTYLRAFEALDRFTWRNNHEGRRYYELRPVPLHVGLLWRMPRAKGRAKRPNRMRRVFSG